MRQGALIGPIIIAIGLVVASISFSLVGALLDTAEGDTELRLERAEDELAALRDEIARLQGDLRDTRAEVSRLVEEIALRASDPAASSAAVPDPSQIMMNPGDETELPPGTEAPTEEVTVSGRRFNVGLTQPRNSTMLEVLGRPRESFSTDCQPVTNARLRDLLETRDVGPIRVTMVRPAMESLERIVDRLRVEEPDLHAALGTAGALCARLIRGSSSAISNHSWGTAIDLKILDRLDAFGDGGTQFALVVLAELFNDEGWFWGATYSREDSMHFEVSEEALRRWAAEGRL